MTVNKFPLLTPLSNKLSLPIPLPKECYLCGHSINEANLNMLNEFQQHAKSVTDDKTTRCPHCGALRLKDNDPTWKEKVIAYHQMCRAA